MPRGRAGTTVMPNHVHFIIVPGDADGLRRTFADAHWRYTGYINARHRWTGPLRQGRHGAVAMDEAHLAAAARYVALNPVRAILSRRAQDRSWSNTTAHRTGEDDELVEVAPLLDRYDNFETFLGKAEIKALPALWRKPMCRPVGSPEKQRSKRKATERRRQGNGD